MTLTDPQTPAGAPADDGVLGPNAMDPCEPALAPAAAPTGQLRRYEIRIRTAMSRPLAASFRNCVRRAVIPRKTIYRLRIREDEAHVDLAEVLQSLTDSHIDVLDIRAFPEPR
jgi:hypothetical protein